MELHLQVTIARCCFCVVLTKNYDTWMKTTTEFPSEGTSWCWCPLPECIDPSGISTRPRNGADLGFSRTTWRSAGLVGSGVQEFCLVDVRWRHAEILPSARREPAWEWGAHGELGRMLCPGLIFPACCLREGLLGASSSLPTLPGRRVPARHKFSA